MIRFLVAAAVALGLAAGTAVAAEAPKGKVTLEQGAAPKQGPVTFDHAGATHKAQKCESCHAKAEGGKITPALDQKTGHATCQKCHMETAKGDPAKKALQACTNCHAKKA
jgi:hypothetical protein